MVNVAETGVTPAEIMMVSISFKVQFFELINVLLFNFVMPVLFYFVYKGPASSFYLNIVHVHGLNCLLLRCP